MSARSHADRGQLFGWDGQTMWVEQTLEPTTCPSVSPIRGIPCGLKAGHRGDHENSGRYWSQGMRQR